MESPLTTFETIKSASILFVKLSESEYPVSPQLVSSSIGVAGAVLSIVALKIV